MQYEKRKKACAILSEIDRNPDNYYIIHYSCESFYDIGEGHTPRITSIAVYSYSSAQTDSFSIHKTAEKKHIDSDEIETKYDELEKGMLDDFFLFVKEHKGKKYIHWNMRDINYGFKAIEHRYEVLGGNLEVIDDSSKIDLARLLIQKYGVTYAGHPRMEKLLELNSIKAKDFLTGKEEGEAFANKEYVKLHQSTLRKVDVFASFINRAIQDTLKVDSKWQEQYGVSPQSVFEYCQRIWWIQLIWSGLMLVLGGLIGKII